MTLESSEVPPESVPVSFGRRLEPGAPPHLPRGYLPRRALWQRLDDAVESPITMLVAPAGAGKTLGVAGWVRDRYRTADGFADDPQAIWIDGRSSWGPRRLVALLADDTTGRQLVIIDDAYKLPPAALRLIEHRLDADPESLHLLLLSRSDLLQTSLVPVLMGALTVLRGDVLRLDDAEVATLVSTHARTDQADVIEAIRSRADGWCAAVVMAARAVGGSTDPVRTAQRIAAGDALFADRVVSEVLAALSGPQRHLLLCIGSERYVTGEAAVHLSHDPVAAELLAELAADGLLVTRVSSPVAGGGPDAGPDNGRAGRFIAAGIAATDVDDLDQEAWYRIHPLMAEVIRRRLATGGVEVERARATVTRAVRLDLARGRHGRAFERLVAVDEIEQASTLLASDGLMMIDYGFTSAITAFVRRHPSLVDTSPDTWFPIAAERWSAGDVEGARHWLDRIVQRHRDAAPDEVDSIESATCSLMRARLGLESIRAAAARAQQLVTRSDGCSDPDGGTRAGGWPYLLVELGATQNWLGELTKAEVNLTAAAGHCSSTLRLSTLAGAATSHLAMNQYMARREHTAAQLAVEAQEVSPYPVHEFVGAQATLVRQLALFADITRHGSSIDEIVDPGRFHPADLCSWFWARIHRARVQAFSGEVAEAEQTMSKPLRLPVADELPMHLRTGNLLEKGRLAALAGDAEGLSTAEAALRDVGARTEARLLTGYRHDLTGDRQAALDAFTAVADRPMSSCRTTRIPALAAQAQLLDAMGQQTAALKRLQEAVAETAMRRNGLAFLGFCRQGTPMQVLLDALAERTAMPWAQELAGALHDRSDLTAVVSANTATPRERATAMAMPVRPLLSARERDVLRELARGSTYADIGAELFVSENTVKTHVSNLYAKLGASRRSEALSVARGMHLL